MAKAAAVIVISGGTIPASYGREGRIQAQLIAVIRPVAMRRGVSSRALRREGRVSGYNSRGLMAIRCKVRTRLNPTASTVRVGVITRRRTRKGIRGVVSRQGVVIAAQVLGT